MFREPSEVRAADKAIVHSAGSLDPVRACQTSQEDIALALSNLPRCWPRDGNGWINPRLSAVYVMEAKQSGLCKVGHTQNLRTRLNMLNVESPVPVELAHFVYVVGPPIAKIVEAESHEALRDQRVRGEWFSCSVEDGASAIFASVRAHGYVWWSEQDRRALGHHAFKIHGRDLARYTA